MRLYVLYYVHRTKALRGKKKKIFGEIHQLDVDLDVKQELMEVKASCTTLKVSIKMK